MGDKCKACFGEETLLFHYSVEVLDVNELTSTGGDGCDQKDGLKRFQSGEKQRKSKPKNVYMGKVFSTSH